MEALSTRGAPSLLIPYVMSARITGSAYDSRKIVEQVARIFVFPHRFASRLRTASKVRMTNVSVDRPHCAFSGVHRNVGILGDTWQILGGMSAPVTAQDK